MEPQQPTYDLETNFGKWHYFNKDNESPNIYIDYGFYSLIASALQRRVWVGDELNPIFPNLYVILVGKAGIGKGQVIFPMLDILRHHKYYPQSRSTQGGKINNISKEELEKAEEMVREAQEMQATMMATAASMPNINHTQPKETPLLFPLLEDATTYEALCQFMSKATRAMPIEEYCQKQGKVVTSRYIHTSLTVGCEDLGTLLREHTTDIVQFMLATYNCRNYTYRTKTKSTDFIKKGCLNLIGGTTPSFMEKIFTDGLLNEGFGSRTFFVFAASKRFNKFEIEPYNEKQLKGRQDLMDYVEKLSHLYGQVTYTKDAWEYLKSWWEHDQGNVKGWRCNMSPKLDAYYARKKLHVIKMAMIHHFSDLKDFNKVDMQINLFDVQQALHILEQAEQSMHHALNVGGLNPLAPVARKIREHLKSFPEGLTKDEIWCDFFEDVKSSGEMDDIIQYLLGVDKLEKVTGKGKKGTTVWLHKYKEPDKGGRLKE